VERIFGDAGDLLADPEYTFLEAQKLGRYRSVTCTGARSS
jgi:hypothetical protein